MENKIKSAISGIIIGTSVYSTWAGFTQEQLENIKEYLDRKYDNVLTLSEVKNDHIKEIIKEGIVKSIYEVRIPFAYKGKKETTIENEIECWLKEKYKEAKMLETSFMEESDPNDGSSITNALTVSQLEKSTFCNTVSIESALESQQCKIALEQLSKSEVQVEDQNKEVYGIAYPQPIKKHKRIKQEKSSKHSPVVSKEEKVQPKQEKYYDIVFNLTPYVKSKCVKKSLNVKGEKIVQRCIKALEKVGIKLSFRLTSKNHYLLNVNDTLPDFVINFFNAREKSDAISVLHGKNKVCTKHFNKVISYLVHFMCIAISTEEVKWKKKASCFQLLKDFYDEDQLDVELLKKLYPKIKRRAKLIFKSHK